MPSFTPSMQDRPAPGGVHRSADARRKRAGFETAALPLDAPGDGAGDVRSPESSRRESPSTRVLPGQTI